MRLTTFPCASAFVEADSLLFNHLSAHGTSNTKSLTPFFLLQNLKPSPDLHFSNLANQANHSSHIF